MEDLERTKDREKVSFVPINRAIIKRYYYRNPQREQEALIRNEFDRLVKPAKMTVLLGYVFRRAERAWWIVF